MTGNVERFVKKLEIKNVIKITGGLIVEEPYVLITYTTGMGKTPKKTEEFLIDNHLYLRGVASSGNRNWGNNFSKAADTISDQYDVPIILKFELAGLENDVNLFIERLREIERLRTQQFNYAEKRWIL